MFRRVRMVARLIREEAISTPEVALAFLRVPRHYFVPTGVGSAYVMDAIPLPDGTSITCPLFVSRMVELLGLEPGQRVLEVGTGTGYQAAILASLGYQVTSVEYSEDLYLQAKTNLRRAGISGVDLRCGDGSKGVVDRAPFDAVVFGCAIPELPPRIAEQVKKGGRVVAPVGDPDLIQVLTVFQKTENDWTSEPVRAAWFVPLRASSL